MTTLKPALFPENFVASMDASPAGKQIVDQPEGECK